MNYWHIQDPDLLLSEQEAFHRFVSDYNHPDLKYRFAYDSENHFIIDVKLPIRPGIDEPWQTWKFRLVYSHNHGQSNSDVVRDGSIKAYILNPVDTGYHHILLDNGRPYVCQFLSAQCQTINSYAAMQRVLRFFASYNVWLSTNKRVVLDK